MARGLTRLQLEFCREYVVDFNGTQAMVRARRTCGEKGTVSSAAVTAVKWLRMAKVQEAIRQFSKDAFLQAGVEPAAVLHGLVEIAFSDARELLDANNALIPIRDLPARVSRSIASIEVDEIWEGAGDERVQVGETKKVKLWNKLPAFEMLGKHLKLFTDQVEFPSGVPLLFETGESGIPGSAQPTLAAAAAQGKGMGDE